MRNEKMKNEKMNYIWDQEGHKGGESSDVLCNTFFVFTKQIFCWHLNFLHFGISNCFVIAKEEFQNKCFYRGIKLTIQKQIWKICFFILFFFVFLEDRTRDLLRGHMRDMWLKIFCKNYGLTSDSVPGNLWHVPAPRTCPGHVQDTSN